MVANSEDAMNKIPLKSASSLDDEERNGNGNGQFYQDTAAVEEARRERMRVNILIWMKKLTIGLICLIGIILISYIIFNLCFPDKSAAGQSTQQIDNATKAATVGIVNSEKRLADTTSTPILDGVSPATAAKDQYIDSETVEPVPVAVEVDKTTIKMPVPVTDPPLSTKFQSKLGVYQKAAVCSDKDTCSKIGSGILKQGGSAVDSAISALLCNGIVTMQSMGIGGGHLMNVFIKSENRAYTIDAREVAAFAATADMFSEDEKKKNSSTIHGGLAIAVPGELMGYYRSHKKFGKLPWKMLIAPSIAICNEGYPLSVHQYSSLKYKLPLINDIQLRKTFVNETTGELHPIGTLIKPSKKLCDTYMMLAEKGPMDFYNGTLAKMVAADLKDLGSIITYGDLEAYNADLVNSVLMPLGDDILYVVPPVSSGTIVANILGILEGYNMSKVDMSDVAHTAKTYHRMAEAMKFGFAKRWELGDMRFNDVRELVSKLTSPDISNDIRHQINDSFVLKHIYDYGARYSGGEDFGTSQVSVLAPNGDAVSVTSSVNDYFGSGQVGKRTGIIFNSCMDDFSITDRSNMFGLPPAPTNYIEPQKRAMSSMSPMILADREGIVRMVIGAAGGSKIISTVVEVVARVLWFGEDIKQAIDAQRIHHQLLPNILVYQEDIDQEIVTLLQRMGHKTKPFPYNGATVCGIVKNETAIYANADYRKRGGVFGF